ncbi:Bestrophin, RFP-TM, chloride channel-domain-containing protein [Mycena vulgaris]|nr:Bestrophin, RFP-TM, chloride channel-domain-containing protein [Mycena vulgaris]
MSQPLRGKRSFTGQHTLLPAMRPSERTLLPKVPTYTFLKWTFGRGSVIWKIWPAILVHTLFAACVVYTWVATGRKLDIPNVMLTVMGVVIGFVISYRAISGYDRYWMGRTAWTDIIRNARTTSRLIWYHTPLRLYPRTPEEAIGGRRAPQEMLKVMTEKRMALDLVEGFVVATKHHLRGELGIYYEDLYDLVRPLHDHDQSNGTASHLTVATAAPAMLPAQQTALGPPTDTQYGTFTSTPSATTLKPNPTSHASKRPTNASTVSLTGATSAPSSADDTSSSGTLGAHSSQASLHTPLLQPASNPGREDAVLRRVAPEMIAFAGLFTSLGRVFAGALRTIKAHREANAAHEDANGRQHGHGRFLRRWAGPMQTVHPADSAARHVHSAGIVDGILHRGQNLPEEVLRCLSEWLGVLEERGTVPGTSLGSLLAGVQAFEVSLATLEQVLTTPLPFVYSSHIRVVWLYLFLLPLQLVSDFEWHTVPAVAVGAFVYLGFVAAGEEIEQPFGYDDNDLDLDMFCRDIVRPDVQGLKVTPCANAYFEASTTTTENGVQKFEAANSATTSGARVAFGGAEPQMIHRASVTEDAAESESDVDGP